MLTFTEAPPLGVYIHIPWCVRKCPYCDFNSHEYSGPLPETACVDTLLRDLEADLPAIWGRGVASIFIGGGTPSLLSPEAVDRLLGGLRALLNPRPNTEVTLEANPGTAEAARFAELRSAGVNRLSIGVQSFRDDALQRLGRIHGRQEALAAVEAAHAAGFDRINLDLMHGLPGQTPADAAADLADAIDLETGHLSWYQLTLEPGTEFGRRPPRLPAEDDLAAIQEAGEARLAAAGFEHYEVSAFARPGRQCQHNLNYWLYGDYLGLGAGAHGKITDPVAGDIRRYWRLRRPQAWLDTGGGEAAVAGEHHPDRREIAFEFLMNALRLADGFPSALFATRTGQPLTVVQETLQQAEADGLLYWDLERIRTTETGWRYLDDLLTRFLPEE